MILQGKATWMGKHILIHKINGRDAFGTPQGGSPTHYSPTNDYIEHLQGAIPWMD